MFKKEREGSSLTGAMRSDSTSWMAAIRWAGRAAPNTPSLKPHTSTSEPHCLMRHAKGRVCIPNSVTPPLYSSPPRDFLATHSKPDCVGMAPTSTPCLRKGLHMSSTGPCAKPGRERITTSAPGTTSAALDEMRAGVPDTGPLGVRATMGWPVSAATSVSKVSITSSTSSRALSRAANAWPALPPPQMTTLSLPPACRAMFALCVWCATSVCASGKPSFTGL
mmetsp:Transcript_8581/g.21665  ORF Transcript_8581/g.21665 Transcript_8581/m.21665 type:complete len:222 (-) Transcript_8581:195-860(-)